MSYLKLLYIEHEKRWKTKIDYNCSNAAIEVKQVDDPNHINSISDNDIKDFDLVLTDVFWPNRETGEENWARLGEVVESVRKRNRRVPIVVLSEKPDAHLEAEKYIKAGQVYDIWSKQGGYPQFLIYRIKNLIRIRQNATSEEILLESTKRLCENNSEAWCNEDVLAFVEEYEGLTGEGITLSAIKKFFKKMAYKAGLEETFVTSVVGTFVESEPLDMARSPDAWGHLRHSLSIFLAGYILLNSNQICFRKDEIINNLGLSDWESINKAWFLASALHDSFIFLEHLPDTIKKIGNLRSNPLYRPLKARVINFGGKFSNNVDLSEIEECNVVYRPEDEGIVKTIIENIDRKDLESSITDYMKIQADHGIIAAVNLYKGIESNPRCDCQVIKAACYPILLHNCIDKIDKKLDEKSDCLAQLLCLFDRFQAWGRENHYEGLLGGTCFEKTVLREFDLSECTNEEAAKTLSMKIDYLPFRYLSPSDKYIQDGEEKLISVLKTNYDSLNRIGFRRNDNFLFWQDIKFKLSFYILGREICI